jgi:hypothetical protein
MRHTSRTAAMVAVALLSLAGWSPPSESADRRDWAEITKQLDQIPSATGKTISARLKACRIKVQQQYSWIVTADTDMPRLDALAGDVVLSVIFSAPPPPGDPPTQTEDLHAQWIVRNGNPIPMNGWARNLQLSLPPLMWMNC